MRCVLTYSGLLLAGALTACSSPATEQPVATMAPVAAVPVVPTDTAKPMPAPSSPALPAGDYPYTLPPVDQTAQYPELQAFVRQVVAACTARRQAALLALVSDSVVVSYGGGISGKASFVSDFLRSEWGGYEKLQEAIKLGGTVQRDSIGRLTATYPYFQDSHLYTTNPLLAKLDLDPYSTYIGLTSVVDVYQRTDATSPRLARLRYPVLMNSGDAPEKPGGWLPVTTADGSIRGYARSSQLHCLADMTLTIESHGSNFWITSVAPFD